MKKFKKILPYIINGLLVLIIFIGSLIVTKTFPFGDNILGKSDAMVQFKPMLYDFIMSIKTQTISAYSFNNALGNPTIFNFLYYLASPLNLVALLFNKPDYMFLSVILLKLSLTALTISFYAQKKVNSNWKATIICLSYVFSSWFLAYGFSLPWLDIFLIFPLFQYGLEKLLNEKKYNLYIFTLAYAMLSNFYLSISIIFYTVCYFIFTEVFYKKQSFKEKLKSFNYLFLSTLVSLLSITFYLYAIYTAFLKRGINVSNDLFLDYKVSVKDFIKAFYYGNSNFMTLASGNTYPNIALNTLVLFNIIYYFMNKKITKKEKIGALIISLLVIAIIFIPSLNWAIDFLNNSIGFVYRYSFIIIMLCLFLLIRNMQTFTTVELKKYFVIGLFLIIGLVLNYKNMDFTIFIFNLVFIISYLILMKFYNSTNLYKGLLILWLVIQSGIGLSYNLVNTEMSKKANENIDKIDYQIEPIKYRLNKASNKEDELLNYNLYSNSNVTYLFSAMNYHNSLNLLTQLGCNLLDDNSVVCAEDNVYFNILFNIKNDYYLEKIYAVKQDILNIDLDIFNTKTSQENLVTAMTGVKDLFHEEILTGKETQQGMEFATNYPFYLIDYRNEDGTIINYPQVYQKFTVANNAKEVKIYIPNNDKIKEVYQSLENGQIHYTHYEDSKIEGTIKVLNDQVIFTSIPYDEDWQIKIDGQVVKPIKLLDSLIGILCAEGTHTITMEYKSHYEGPILISLITFIFLIINIVSKRKKI